MAAGAAKKGDYVTVRYVGTLDEGTVFDKGELSFTVGGGEMIEGFDTALVGMNITETKKVRVPPEQAYGQPDDELIIDVPLYKLATSGVMPKPGTEVVIGGREGRVVRVTDRTATVDFNPPFVGKTLNFSITLLAVK